MTTKEFQQMLHDKTGLKISVKKGAGSMKGYFMFWPQFQGGEYPMFNHEQIKEIGINFKGTEEKPNFFTTSEVYIYGLEFEQNITFKKESKPKDISQMTVKQWGSKNSQIRLDKAIKRNAKRMQNGNTAKYW